MTVTEEEMEIAGRDAKPEVEAESEEKDAGRSAQGNRPICLVTVMSTFRGATTTVDPPSGLLLVGGSLKKKGFDVRLFHVHPKDTEKVAEEIVRLDPLFLGVSTMTCSRLKEAIEISRHAKSRGITTIWGGIHPSLLPEQTLREDYVDFVSVGEGEELIREFVDELIGEQRFENIKGLGFKREGELIINPRRQFIWNLDQYDLDWSLVNIEDYIHPEPLWGCKRVLHIQTSRGCPFRCAFCYNRAFTNGVWRGQSADHVIQYIEWLKSEYGVDGLVINDDNFFVHRERAFQILEKTGIPIWADCPIKYIDEAFAERLSKTPAKSIFLGIESGSSRSLERMNKTITTKDTLRVIKLMSKHPRITINGAMIVGIPGEEWDDIDHTIDLALRISDLHPNVALNIGTFVPYPGSELFQEAQKRGFKAPASTQEWAEFDIVDNDNMDLSWLDWADRKAVKKMFIIDKCAIHLNRTGYGNFWQRAAKKVLHHMAYFRLKHRFFAAPLELELFGWYYTRYLTDKFRKKENAGNENEESGRAGNAGGDAVQAVNASS